MMTLDQARESKVAPWEDSQIAWQDFHVVVFKDKFPVTEGHLLFVPTHDTPGLIQEAFASALHTGDLLVKEGKCDSYNIGINMGRSAGQTVMYPHVHLIPRRSGDTHDPVGGVRGVIPGQANYRKETYRIPCDTDHD